MELESFDLNELEEFTSKSRLTQILKISSRTMHAYHQLALLIEDFENDYPSITKESKAITKAALTRYQCWVIYCLILVCRRLSKSDVYECLNKGSNPGFTAKFSKANYQLIMNEGIESNEITRI